MERTVRLMIIALLLCALGLAQQKTPPKTSQSPAKSPAAKSTSEAKPAAAESKAALPTEATVAAFLKRMFGYDQNLAFRVAEIKPSEASGLAEATVVVNTPQGQQVSKFYITPDQQHAIVGDLIPFGADPFASTRTAVEKGAFGPTKGPKDGMLMVEFGDLQCPACKQAQPNIDKLLSEVQVVKLVFQNFPLEQIHPWAGQAARYVDCLYRAKEDSAWTFIEATYSHQGEITEANVTDKLNNYVKMAGADPTAIAACAAKPDTAERIKKSLDLGKDVGITGTPTLFVNGRKLGNVSGMPYEALKAIVEYELQQKK